VIDLHTHSHFSDGSLAPEELVARAARVGVTGLALTDHDTTAGVPSFMAACAAHDLVGVPGVEISADWSHGTMHILGYFIDVTNVALQEGLARIRGGREERNVRILAKLQELETGLTWDEVTAFAGSDVVGRPHFALALIKRGVVGNKQRAFTRFLGKGAPAYFDRFRLSPHDALALIRSAGGVPVLAHPNTLRATWAKLRRTVADLAEHGLGGIETYYSEHPPRTVEQLGNLARDFGLVATGGSDFHGDLNPDIEIGRGFGQLKVPDAVIPALQQQIVEE
jgi:predicted metal-dependent phosphoesterase TrpH